MPPAANWQEKKPGKYSAERRRPGSMRHKFFPLDSYYTKEQSKDYFLSF